MCELTTSQKHIITELNNSRGEYKPAFMQIRIHDSYDVFTTDYYSIFYR